MYTPEQQELLEKVEQLQRERNISQNEVGKLIGISGTALSQIKNGKYAANPQKVFDILSNYFGVKEKAKLTYTEIDYAPTSISTQIYDIISVCQVKGGLAVAADDAGIGKTKAAQKFVSDNPTNSVLITVNPCLTSIKSILKALADRISASPERSRDELWLAIAKKLSDGIILIFDEAQHLTVMSAKEKNSPEFKRMKKADRERIIEMSRCDWYEPYFSSVRAFKAHVKIAWLPEAEASDRAHLINEAAAWENICTFVKVNNDDEINDDMKFLSMQPVSYLRISIKKRR